jgi:hypothetical protein
MGDKSPKKREKQKKKKTDKNKTVSKASAMPAVSADTGSAGKSK